MCKFLKRYSVFAILSFIFGLFSIKLMNPLNALNLFSFLPGLLSWFTAPFLALLFGFLSLKEMKKKGVKGKPLAILGITLGILGIVFNVWFFSVT